jgi:serine/threonine protein kinase
VSLAPGITVGPYEVTASLGAGGMGEVWRALDPRLDREVALKVLPEDIAHGTERHARFEREAKLLAALNHPNIATLFGIEHLDAGLGESPSHVLVMELVAGEGLDERISRGPLGVAEAVPIALQIASGLIAAHEKGIVHRDLKPANVRIRPDNTAKVLDFGLAKSWQNGGTADLAHSPTITTRHSLAGAILGTAAYMSPEQARGRAVDHRADIWGFGCLLFEMLTGEQAFAGETISDTIAAILKEQPAWTALPAGVPPAVHRVLRRCLAKDSELRYQHLADARLELLEIDRSDPGFAGATEKVSAGQSVRGAGMDPDGARWARHRRPLAYLAGSVGLAAVAVALITLLSLGRSPSGSQPSFRPLTFRSGHVSSARFAPDGKTIIYGMMAGGQPLSLYSTRSNSIESRRLDLPPADVLGIADDGRMLILLDRHREGTWVSVGTLAETDLAGGAPRRLLERVNDGAIAADGSVIAVVRELGSEQQLEFPLGRPRFRTQGWISHVSISTDGQRVAFLHHPFYGDDRGVPMLLDREGEPHPLAPESANSLQGLVWSPDGRAIWYSEFVFGAGGVLWSVRPGGQPRAVFTSPTGLRIQDIAADGRALLTASDTRAEIVGLLAGQEREQRYEGWNDDSIGGIAADGSMFAANQQQSNEEGEYSAYVRSADGSAAIRLGQGFVLGMSPDGHWVFLQRMTRDRNQLQLFPTGPGHPYVLDLGTVTPVTSVLSLLTCSLNGRAAFTGRNGAGEAHPYVLDLDTLGLREGEDAATVPLGVVPRQLGPAGAKGALISPDGTRVASLAPDSTIVIYPVDGGDPVPVPGLVRGELPLQWTLGGQALLVWDHVLPARIVRVRISDGQREPALEIMPQDPAGVLYGQIILAPGGKHYVYRYRRDLSTLFLVSDLR